MKNATLFQAIVAAVLLGVSAVASATDRLPDPDVSYSRAAVLYEDGLKAVEAGRPEAAMGKMKLAQTLIQKISQSQPGWQPALVAYKLQKIENILKDLDAAHAQQHAAVPGTHAAVTSP